MHLVVCIKQVPDTADVRIDPRTNTLVREGVRSVVNAYDTYAIEEALRLRARLGGRVTVLSMGPPQADRALREALAMGADEAILVSGRALAGSDTWATSLALAAAIRRLGGADLVLFGKQASDGDTAQVGPGVAAHLGWPVLTYARRVSAMDDRSITVERLLENGVETVMSSLPCVLTAVKELNDPRLPSLAGVLRARQAAVARWDVSDLGLEPRQVGLEGSPTRVVRVFTPPPRQGGGFLRGTPAEMAGELAATLRALLGSMEATAGGASR